MNRLPETSKRVRAIQKRYHYALEVLEDSELPEQRKALFGAVIWPETNGSQTSALEATAESVTSEGSAMEPLAAQSEGGRAQRAATLA
jgi:hypothetical protein